MISFGIIEPLTNKSIYLLLQEKKLSHERKYRRNEEKKNVNFFIAQASSLSFMKSKKKR